jgi:hypothetical protein
VRISGCVEVKKQGSSFTLDPEDMAWLNQWNFKPKKMRGSSTLNKYSVVKSMTEDLAAKQTKFQRGFTVLV